MNKHYAKAKQLIEIAKVDGPKAYDETVAFWICYWRGYVEEAQRMWKANERRHSVHGFRSRTQAVIDTIRRAPRRLSL